MRGTERSSRPVKLLSVTPCLPGHTPVSIEDQAGPLTEGVVVRTWAVYQPAAARASMLGVGTSASTSGRTPSMPIRRTLGVPWGPPALGGCPSPEAGTRRDASRGSDARTARYVIVAIATLTMRCDWRSVQ